MPILIGLDFGTTNTRVQKGYTEHPDRPDAVRLPKGDGDSLPTVILLDDSGLLLADIGLGAVEALLDVSLRDRVKYHVKPCLGRSQEDLAAQAAGPKQELQCPACGAKIPEGFRFCGECAAPLPEDYRKLLGERGLAYEQDEAFEYARLLLDAIGKYIRQRELGGAWGQDDRIVVGVPVHWSHTTRERYRAVVAAAFGHEGVEIVEEPRAALADYLSRAGSDIRSGETVLVVDVGGGTTDLICGVIQDDGSLDQVRQHGIRFAGADFDKRVVDWAMRELMIPQDATGLEGALLPICRTLKEQLSDEIRLGFSENPSVRKPVRLTSLEGELTLDKATFESDAVCGSLFEHFADRLRDEIRVMGLRPEDMSRVLLVGGGSNAYFVEDVVRRCFPEARVESGGHPEMAISKGLLLASVVRPLPTAVAEPTKRASSKGRTETATGAVLEVVLEAELDEPKTRKTVKSKTSDVRLQTPIRYIRRHTKKGEGRAEIEAQLLDMGVKPDDIRVAWLLVSDSGADEEVVSTPAAVATPTAGAIGLWGPAEAFPDVVELLEAGKWSEARNRAASKRPTKSHDRAALAEVVLFVRLLADVADRSYHVDGGQGLGEMAEEVVGLLPRSGTARYLRGVASLLQAEYGPDAVYIETSFTQDLKRRAIDDAEAGEAISPDEADGQFISMIVNGNKSKSRLLNDDGTAVEPPSTILGHLLLATALQATDPRLRGFPGVVSLPGARDLLRDIATEGLSSDPGIRVLQRWQGTLVEPQLLHWLGGFVAVSRGLGIAAAYRRLVKILEHAPPDQFSLLSVAEAQWLLSLWLSIDDKLGREWSDRAAMTAWQHILRVAPKDIVVLSVIDENAGTPSGVRVLSHASGGKAIGGETLSLYSTNGGCVLRFWPTQLRFEANQFALWDDGFIRLGVFYPFAAIRDVSTTAGMIWTGVTVFANNGGKVVDDQAWSNENAQALKKQFDEWRRKWGDIADGKRDPKRV